MAVGLNEVTQLLENVWDSVLGLPLQPCAAEDSTRNDGAMLTGSVQITGEWQGAVILEFPVELARRAAARLFSQEPQAVASGDVHDALGELSNIIGGNIKALFPGPCYLSLPEVVDGIRPRHMVRNTAELFRGTYACNESHFVVKVLERQLRT